MRKLLVVLGIAFLLVAGCEVKTYTVVIENKSTETVSYTYNGSADMLNANTSKTYEVSAYTQPPVITSPEPIILPDGSKKKIVVIEYNTTTGDYTFVDNP